MELKNLLNKKIILILITVLFAFIAFILVLNLFKPNTNNNNNGPLNSQEGLFIPPTNPGYATDLSGKLKRMSNVKGEDKIRYLLEDENGKIIVYLSSEKLNLDLSEGMDVLITGKIIKDSKLDKSVVVIEKLKLK